MQLGTMRLEAIESWQRLWVQNELNARRFPSSNVIDDAITTYFQNIAIDDFSFAKWGCGCKRCVKPNTVTATDSSM